MKKSKIILLAMILFSTLGMVSCSEDEGIVEEYPNWQVTNETFFYNLTKNVKTLIAQDPTRTDWKRIKAWSKIESEVEYDDDFVIVNVIESAPATETTSPLYTDTVLVHYQGNLLPSTSYNIPSVPYNVGLRFDASYEIAYNADTSVPVELAIGNSLGNGLIDGFATALQNMRRGDHWVVYIPYKLAYGVTGYGNIPPYSTLIFEIRLVDYWK